MIIAPSAPVIFLTATASSTNPEIAFVADLLKLAEAPFVAVSHLCLALTLDITLPISFCKNFFFAALANCLLVASFVIFAACFCVNCLTVSLPAALIKGFAAIPVNFTPTFIGAPPIKPAVAPIAELT